MKSVGLTASNGARRRYAARGYTLIEVVIALTIVGLIMGFIFEGVFGAARLATRLSDRAAVLEHDAMASDWFRQTVAAALPAQQRDPPALAGEAQKLSFYGAQSLHARPGAPRLITWRLSNAGPGETLSYDYDGNSWPIARNRGSGAYFAYYDDKGSWRRDWKDHAPPRLVALVGFWSYPILAAPRARAALDQPDPQQLLRRAP